jgi:hypothetical protein
LGRIQRLCCLGIGGEMLMPDLIHEVMGLIPSRHGIFHWSGSNGEIVNSYGTVRGASELYFREFHRTRRETDVISTFSDHQVLAYIDASIATQSDTTYRSSDVFAE